MSARAESQPDPFDRWRNVEVAGAIGKIIFASVPMKDEDARKFWDAGIPIPLDIVPNSFWREPGAEFHRFSEEMLGEDF